MYTNQLTNWTENLANGQFLFFVCLINCSKNKGIFEDAS